MNNVLKESIGIKVKKAFEASAGVRAQQKSNEDRTIAFKQWHRSLGKEMVATDIDMIEWRWRDNKLIPVALLELTRIDGQTANDLYLNKIIERYGNTFQGKAAVAIANRLFVNAYIVLFNPDLTAFYVFNISKATESLNRWKHYTRSEMEWFLRRL